MSLAVENVTKQFGRFPALNGVSIKAEPGEFLALLGPSGSGKTTLLRCIAGLETPDSGNVTFDGQDFLKQTARQRRVGMVFQHYALFRHMTVAKNIAFGLRVRPSRERPPKAEITATVERLLKLVQLDGLGTRYPAQLSGGQRQRVALARALAIQPRLLLLDEPFGALDAKVRKELRHWLRQVHNETGVTTIFVTHDQEEAMDLADRVVVLKLGQIEQVGTPEQLDESPATPFVFDFLGDHNKLPCRVEGSTAHFDGFDAPAVRRNGVEGQSIGWFRPYETDLFAADQAGVPVRVSDILIKAGAIRCECSGPEGQMLEADYARGELPDYVKIGAGLKLRPRRVCIFPES